MAQKQGRLLWLPVAMFSASLLRLASPAFAVPTLQLDILGGTYDPLTETIIAPGPDFTLVALLTPGPHDVIASLLGDTYYISAALLPQRNAPVDAGSFTFQGSEPTTVQVTEDMDYGVPPLETVVAHDPNDLPQHGIFETYFWEHGFQFAAADEAAIYNSAETPGGLNTEGSGLYYHLFDVNVSGLASGYLLHFDLYNTEVARRSVEDIDVDDFAPFSHDAQSRTVPEPGAMLLLGAGLIGLSVVRRRRSAQS